MKSKLQAFTLFELVLGMLLAAIVIGMAYYASSIFSRLFDGYSKMNYAQSELALFKKVLLKDVESAAAVNFLDDALLLRDEQGQVALSYELARDRIVRRGLQTDTFKLDNLLVQGTFEGHEQASGLTDVLLFSFEYAGEPALFQVKKHYSSADLFKLKN